MLNKKELALIVILALVLGFAISLMETLEIFLYTSLSVLLIFLINITAKKLTAFYYDTDIEIRLWELRRTGFFYFVGVLPVTTPSPHHKFKHPFPLGIFVPILSAVLTFGNFTWMASYVFDAKEKIYKAAKRHGLYKFSEITEFHLGLIAASGIVANLALAFVGYLIGLPEQMNFVTLSIWFAFFNMLPISDLDGNKVFFGNLVLWATLASICFIGVLYTLFVI